MNAPLLLTGLFGLLLLALAAGVVFNRLTLYAALHLVLVSMGIAVCYGILGASFLASMQVLVYSGAVMVLFLFVLMLLADPQVEQRRFEMSFEQGFALAAVPALGYFLLPALIGTLPAQAQGHADGSVLAVAQLLLGKYILVFEAASLLLLLAVVGAMLLGWQRKEKGWKA